jgi:hypothetical protein
MGGFKLTGRIEKILPAEDGVSKAGKEWKKITFIVKTDDEYNNTYAMGMFGAEKVDKFIKYNKEGDLVDIDFNISTNEWNGKYFTGLDAWKVFKSTSNTPSEAPKAKESEEDDLPF